MFQVSKEQPTKQKGSSTKIENLEHKEEDWQKWHYLMLKSFKNNLILDK